MLQADLFSSPMTRKKRVPDKYCPNTWRVISQDAESATGPVMDKEYTTSMSDFRNVIGQRSADLLHSPVDYRQNRPNPRSVGFLRQDVALLNEPLCDVRTAGTANEQHDWWPTRANNTQPSIPSHTLDTTVRKDFQYRGDNVPPVKSRGPSNQGGSRGIVPVTKIPESDKKPTFWKEGISYEHQFNSRTDPQYANRGMRHGHFVWNRMGEEDVAKVIKDVAISNSSSNRNNEHVQNGMQPASLQSPISNGKPAATSCLPPVD